MLHEHQTPCPYCGERFTAYIDLSQGNQQTIEDCYVCCRPIEFIIESDGQSLIRVDTFTDDENAF
ncbi:CPXCG motif-containing cysteine-rich protein [Arenicella sp. 4NH20-0111]|uniref:CPXCG motif-containing cysteine-rich protein n=1 Tax=Arenicella sp. 4NH20-0111 TaxID=3127648 RepID=UPI0031069B87